jgi:hypothetical protein
MPETVHVPIVSLRNLVARTSCYLPGDGKSEAKARNRRTLAIKKQMMSLCSVHNCPSVFLAHSYGGSFVFTVPDNNFEGDHAHQATKNWLESTHNSMSRQASLANTTSSLSAPHVSDIAQHQGGQLSIPLHVFKWLFGCELYAVNCSSLFAPLITAVKALGWTIQGGSCVSFAAEVQKLCNLLQVPATFAQTPRTPSIFISFSIVLITNSVFRELRHSTNASWATFKLLVEARDQWLRLNFVPELHGPNHENSHLYAAGEDYGDSSRNERPTRRCAMLKNQGRTQQSVLFSDLAANNDDSALSNIPTQETPVSQLSVPLPPSVSSSNVFGTSDHPPLDLLPNMPENASEQR